MFHKQKDYYRKIKDKFSLDLKDFSPLTHEERDLSCNQILKN